MEVVSAAACAAFGGWLLLPWWNTYALSRAYAALASLLPQPAAGLVLATVGGAGLLAAGWGTPTARRAALLAQGSLWVFLFVSFVASAPGAAGAALYLAAGGGCFACWWALGGGRG